jgi:hypothetical protein
MFISWGKWLPTNYEESLEVEGEDGWPSRFVELRRWWRMPNGTKMPEPARKVVRVGLGVLASPLVVFAVEGVVCFLVWVGIGVGII